MTRNRAPVNPTLERSTILQIIEHCLQQAEAWTNGADTAANLNTAVSFLNRAEALIELLEVDDCGATGGFDLARGQDKQPKKHQGYRTLQERFAWLEKIS